MLTGEVNAADTGVAAVVEGGGGGGGLLRGFEVLRAGNPGGEEEDVLDDEKFNPTRTSVTTSGVNCTLWVSCTSGVVSSLAGLASGNGVTGSEGLRPKGGLCAGVAGVWCCGVCDAWDTLSIVFSSSPTCVSKVLTRSSIVGAWEAASASASASCVLQVAGEEAGASLASLGSRVSLLLICCAFFIGLRGKYPRP